MYVIWAAGVDDDYGNDDSNDNDDYHDYDVDDDDVNNIIIYIEVWASGVGFKIYEYASLKATNRKVLW